MKIDKLSKHNRTWPQVGSVCCIKKRIYKIISVQKIGKIKLQLISESNAILAQSLVKLYSTLSYTYNHQI